MITLSNKKINYTLVNESETMILNGNVSIAEDGRITDFNGQFQNKDRNYIGSFYYNENEMGKANKNINDVEVDLNKAACDFLDATIVELKNVND